MDEGVDSLEAPRVDILSQNKRELESAAAFLPQNLFAARADVAAGACDGAEKAHAATVQAMRCALAMAV